MLNPAHAETATLTFPFDAPPETGTVREVAPGILWTRIPLPFRLDHVNIYLIEDGDGWAVLDTGIADQPTRDVWDALVAGPLKGRRLTRLIVTHFHPDHIGIAGWLCEKHGLELLTSQTCYLGCINISLSPNALEAEPYQKFYLKHGMPADRARRVSTNGHAYLRMVTPLPPTFSISPSCSARSTLAWARRLMSPISSRNRVPPWACRNLPSRSAVAPVNAPFTEPNSSLSMSSSGMAAQLTFTKGPPLRGP